VREKVSGLHREIGRIEGGNEAGRTTRRLAFGAEGPARTRPEASDLRAQDRRQDHDREGGSTPGGEDRRDGDPLGDGPATGSQRQQRSTSARRGWTRPRSRPDLVWRSVFVVE
jgi:hypothetical protein